MADFRSTVPSSVLFCTNKHPLLLSIGCWHSFRSRRVKQLTPAYLALLVGRKFIDVQNYGEFFSPQLPESRKTFGLCVVLSVERLIAAHNASRVRHTLRTGDGEQLFCGQVANFHLDTVRQNQPQNCPFLNNMRTLHWKLSVLPGNCSQKSLRPADGPIEPAAVNGYRATSERREPVIRNWVRSWVSC